MMNLFSSAVPKIARTIAIASVTIMVSLGGLTSKALADLYYGSFGPDVQTLQQRLTQLGYYRGPIDGDYGTTTEEAVRQFQSAQRLEYVDGIAGPETLRALGLDNLGGGFPVDPGFPGFPGTPGSVGDCGFYTTNPFIVAIPGSNVNFVRQFVSTACQDYSDRGKFVNAGSYRSRSEAELLADRLRGRGLDARVHYRQ
jgi:Putative peptidoglycan binding domain